MRVLDLLVHPLSSNLDHMLHVCILAFVLAFSLLASRISNLERDHVRTVDLVETSPS